MLKATGGLAGFTIALGAVGFLYFLYRYYRNSSVDSDEGFSEKAECGKEPLPKRILVLGLDGAGKSCLLACLSGKNESEVTTEPTGGFNVVSLQNEKGLGLDIWEIGGAQEVRKYWPNFIQDTEVLVFVIDSTDRSRFPDAYTEMHKLLGEPRLLNKPFVVVANKQDLTNAANTLEIKEALGLEDIKHHRVQIVETTLTPLSSSNVVQIKDLLLKL